MALPEDTNMAQPGLFAPPDGGTQLAAIYREFQKVQPPPIGFSAREWYEFRFWARAASLAGCRLAPWGTW